MDEKETLFRVDCINCEAVKIGYLSIGCEQSLSGTIYCFKKYIL